MLVIAAILATVAFRSAVMVTDAARVEETKQELNRLAEAMVGNPESENNGIRNDFGYVGDVGALPPDLDALVQNPGGYATWRGPYIRGRFEQITDDHKKDAWNQDYIYTGGVTISSAGGPAGGHILHKLANDRSDLTGNQVGGTILDLDGTPPGSIYKDSLVVQLTHPNGSGGMTSRRIAPDAGGFFSYDSIPIGNHDLEITYLPDSDTLRRFVSVLPSSSLYATYRLSGNVWPAPAGGPSGITKVPGSDSLAGGCNGFFFWITNNSGHQITVDAITVTWTAPIAYYGHVRWNGALVVNRTGDRVPSGETVAFSSPRTIHDGENVRIDVDKFKTTPSGGPDVDMNNVTFTVDFSDGSSVTVTTGACP